jgi:transmembrane sensor
VTLGAQSAISVQFSAGRRSVSVDYGEAWFKVAHNPARPFMVAAGPKTITALGTAFVVQRDTDRVIVTVTEGTEEVAPRRSADAEPLALQAVLNMRQGGTRVVPGERLSYNDGGSASVIEPADPQAATAWSEGQLEFDHMPLRDVVQVINRYSRRTIAVDRSSGAKIFTGLVLQDQIDKWIHRLAAIYPVEILVRGEQVCVRARDQASHRDPSSCGDAK